MNLVFHRRRRSRAWSRFLLVAVSLVLLATLAACGDDDPDPTAPPPTAFSATAEAPAATTVEASPATSASPLADAASPVASPTTVPTPLAPIALTPGPGVTAEQALRFGAGRVANLQSVHFKATIEGTVYIDDPRTLQLVSAEGNVVRPDRVQTQFRLRIGDQAITDIRLVTVADDAWMTDIVSGEWVPALVEFGYDASILFDPEDGLAPVMLGVENPVLTGSEEVGDRAAYVVEATGNEELIGPVTSHTMTGYPVTVRAWIDQETGDLLKIVLIEPPSPENADPATWTLELSRFDAEITIEPPEIDD